MRQVLLTSVAIVAAALPVTVSAQASSSDDKANAIVSKMSLDEQLMLVKGHFPAFERNMPADAIIGAGYIPGNPRLGLPPLRETDAGMGVANLLNKRTDDVATSLPSGLAVAATWDRQLAFDGGAMIGSEARAKGFNVLLAGSVNLVREPRNGRNFEYAGEDPLLSGIMVGEAVKGIQSNHIISTVKHYALNAQETGRNVLNAKLDEAAFRESDLLAFQIAIEVGNPGSVMCAYNKVNGAYTCENPFLLNQVLKTDWGYKGWVMSDWGSVHSTKDSALAGLDHQSGFRLDKKPWFGEPLKQAVASGEVPADRVRDMSFRIVRSMFEYGLMDHPVPNTPEPINYQKNALVSQRAAEGGIVLLQNKKNILPLAAEGKRVAIIGGRADIGVLSGGGSSQVRPVGGPALEMVPKGMSAAFARVTYFPSSPMKALQERFPDGAFSFASGEDIAEAVALAKSSDVVIVFADQWTTESEDVPTMDLPGNQNALIEAVSGASQRVVVVLQTGGPVAMPWKDKVEAIVEAWYPGSNGGQAIARVLAGDVDAAGRLPVTFPVSIEQTPRPVLDGLTEKKNSKGEVTYGLAAGLKTFDVDYNIEGANQGYRWFALKNHKPLFPFGFGLSYTRFAYSNLKADGQALSVSYTVKNTGRRKGIDTPQVYAIVGDRDGNQVRRLVGWSRASLNPDQSERYAITIDPRLLANFDVKAQRWVVRGGTYKLHLARSAADTVLETSINVAEQTIKP
jgi:beta-glucosidase